MVSARHCDLVSCPADPDKATSGAAPGCQFRALLERVGDVITRMDSEGRIDYVSPSSERVFGLAPHAVVGRRFSSWVHPADRDAAMAALARAGAQPSEHPVFTCRLRHADGSWCYVESVVTDIAREAGAGNRVMSSRDVTTRHLRELALQERAFHDDLTGLANRSLFMDRASHHLSRRRAPAAARSRLAVLFLDLDDFKSVNDSLGHAAGDLLLTQVAERLMAAVRGQDTVTRLGGDEFAILIEDAGLDEANAVAAHILAVLAPPYDLSGRRVYSGASIGVASNQDEALDARELLTRADIAMYDVKSQGKGGFSDFMPSELPELDTHLSVSRELRYAEEGNQLFLRYQPVVSLQTGAMVGLEALARWQHPVHGLISSADFLPAAEDSGLIVPIGAWMLREACTQVRRLQHAHPVLDRLLVRVPVTARQLRLGGLEDTVAAALNASGLDAGLLVLDFGGCSLTDRREAVSRLRGLKALGVRLAIDDLAAADPSASRLGWLPADQLHVTGALVAGLDEHGPRVAELIGQAHARGMETMARDVETTAQFEKLAELGCDLAQGRNWCPELSVEDLELLMSANGQQGREVAARRVLLVDDRREARGLVRLAMELDGRFSVVAEARDGYEATTAAEHHLPDLVLLDLAMPGMDGFEALARLRTVVPEAAIVVLTVVDTSDVPTDALTGAAAVLDKAIDLDELLDQLSTVAVGTG